MADDKKNAAKDNKAAPPLTQSFGTVSPSPETTGWSVLQSAYLASKHSVGSAPLTFLDKAASGMRDLFVKNLRSMLSPAVDAGMVSLGRDALVSPMKVIDFLRGAAGDEKFAASLERSIESSMAGRSKPNKFGEYDLNMAVGWKPEGPIRINGKDYKQGEKIPSIDNMLAVFVRSPDGTVEILDPSTKVRSFSEIGGAAGAAASTLIPDVVRDKLGLKLSDVDKRWERNAGQFMLTQLAPMVLGPMMGKGAVAKSVTSLGVVGNVGDGIDMAQGLASGVLNEMDFNKLVTGLSGILTNPKMMSNHDLRTGLNKVLDEHSSKEGTNAKQIYIPSLKGNDDPWQRFESLLGGSVDGFKKPNTPWDKWSHDSNMPLGDVRKALRENPEFKKMGLKVAEKALSGQALDDREYLVLRINLDTQFRRMSILSSDNGQMKFSSEERAETLDALRVDVSRNMRFMSLNNPRLAEREYGIKPKPPEPADKGDDVFADAKAAFTTEKYSDQVLLKYVRAEYKNVCTAQAQELQQAIARAPTFN